MFMRCLIVANLSMWRWTIETDQASTDDPYDGQTQITDQQDDRRGPDRRVTLVGIQTPYSSKDSPYNAASEHETNHKPRTKGLQWNGEVYVIIWPYVQTPYEVLQYHTDDCSMLSDVMTLCRSCTFWWIILVQQLRVLYNMAYHLTCIYTVVDLTRLISKQPVLLLVVLKLMTTARRLPTIAYKRYKRYLTSENKYKWNIKRVILYTSTL